MMDFDDIPFESPTRPSSGDVLTQERREALHQLAAENYRLYEVWQDVEPESWNDDEEVD